MTYKTIVIDQVKKAKKLAMEIENKANEMAKSDWELVTFSTVASGKAVLVFRTQNDAAAEPEKLRILQQGGPAAPGVHLDEAALRLRHDGKRPLVLLKQLRHAEKAGRREKIDQGLPSVFVKSVQLGRAPHQIENPRQLIRVADNILALLVLRDAQIGADIKGKVKQKSIFFQNSVRGFRALCALQFHPPKFFIM